MARCAKCGKQVVAGVVLCSQCYEGAGSAPATAEELQKLADELDRCAGQAATDLWKLPATLPDTCAIICTWFPATYAWSVSSA